MTKFNVPASFREKLKENYYRIASVATERKAFSRVYERLFTVENSGKTT